MDRQVGSCMRFGGISNAELGMYMGTGMGD